MLWAALLLDPATLPAWLPTEPDRRLGALRGVATWCLQFTPRVAYVDVQADVPAVVMEVDASTRLFGGKRRLAERVRDESKELGVCRVAWAPTSLAAVALARAGLTNGFRKALNEHLDDLPLEVLVPVARHGATLSRVGCRTLGQVRALPRGGLGRRFDKELLVALDQAYGLRPEVHAWIELPEHFNARLELMSRVELAPALLFGARRLLLQMCGWLAARHCGVTAFTLRWWHDVMRAKSAGDGGEMTIRTAETMRNIEHLSRLLAEQLAKTELLAPVGDLELVATEVQALEEQSASLLPDPVVAGESLNLVLERIAARFGPERVLRPELLEDHRPEWMSHWQSAARKSARRPAQRLAEVPQPTFLLDEPLRLAVREHRPIYQGPLQLLLGPHRVEGGWWDRTVAEGEACTRHVARDYFVALSEHAGVLWVFQTRLADDEAAWFLHGTFA
jgi:protein ImuB